MKARPAFTLVELIVALVMSAFVIVGLVGVASQMMRNQMEGTQKSANTNYTLMSLNAMLKELQVSNVLYCPSENGIDHTPLGGANCGQQSSSVLSGCIDYSFKETPPGPLDRNAANVKSFYYCVLPANSIANQTTAWLLHYSMGPGAATCPISPVPTCGQGQYDVVAQDVQQGSDPDCGNYFCRADDANGVKLLFQIGASTTSTSVIQTKTYQLINSKVPIQRVYTDTVD